MARNEKPEIPEQRIRKKFTIVKLKNKKTNQREEYKLYDNVDLSFLRAKIDSNKLILDFNMEKLELEYDYDTDEDQLRAARDMLMHENISAVEFIIKEEVWAVVTRPLGYDAGIRTLQRTLQGAVRKAARIIVEKGYSEVVITMENRNIFLPQY